MNPKDQIAATKLPLELWPSTATAVGCVAFLEGKLKYGRMNWRAQPVFGSVYFAAMLRHISLWFEGEDFDPESLVPHLGSALACGAILVDAGASGTLIDDRQYGLSQGYRDLVKSLLPVIEHLQKLHAERDPTHYSKATKHAEKEPRPDFVIVPWEGTHVGVRVTHVRTGEISECNKHRDRESNQEEAMRLLKDRLAFVELDPKDLLIRNWSSNPTDGWIGYARSRGIEVTHIPTGTIIQVDSERSQHQNRALALNRLREALNGKQT